MHRLALTTAARFVSVAILDFLFLRIWAPDLVNLHQDLALAGAIACVLLAIALTGWLAVRLWLDVPKLTRAYRRPNSGLKIVSKKETR
jgi:hypothetical protein